MSFNSAWNLVKYRNRWQGGERPGDWTEDDTWCCGITADQAAEQSWNFCPFCGEKVPEELVASYDTIMHGHPDVEGEY